MKRKAFLKSRSNICIVLFSFSALQLVKTNLTHSVAFVTGFCRKFYLKSIGLFGKEKKVLCENHFLVHSTAISYRESYVLSIKDISLSLSKKNTPTNSENPPKQHNLFGFLVFIAILVAVTMYWCFGGHLFSAGPHGLSTAAESQGNHPCTQSMSYTGVVMFP